MCGVCGSNSLLASLLLRLFKSNVGPADCDAGGDELSGEMVSLAMRRSIPATSQSHLNIFTAYFELY